MEVEKYSVEDHHIQFTVENHVFHIDTLKNSKFIENVLRFIY